MSHTAGVKPFQASVLMRYSSASPADQRGAASLFVILVLLLALALIVLAMARVGVQEQTISGNEQRSYKAINAAQAGIEYGINWLGNNFGDFDDEYLVDDTTCACWPKTLTVPNNITPGSGETYNVSVTITPQGRQGNAATGCQTSSCLSPSSTIRGPYLQVVSVATDANDNSVRSSVEQYAIKSPLGSAGSPGATPIVINGCIVDGTFGNPKVVPAGNTYDTEYHGKAMTMATNALTNDRPCPPASTPDECPPPPPDECPSPPNHNPKGVCPDPDTIDSEAEPPNPGCPRHAQLLRISDNGAQQDTLDETDHDAAWNAIFPGMDKETFKNLADYENDLMNSDPPRMTQDQRTFIYLDPSDPRADDPADWGFNSNTWSMNLGTGNVQTENPDSELSPSDPCGTTEPRRAIHPVILYFGNGGSSSSNCPKMNGDPVIWGVLYYESCATNATGNGWGGFTMFGIAAIDSSVDKINSNTTFCGIDNQTDGSSSEDKVYEKLVRIPGTWNEL